MHALIGNISRRVFLIFFAALVLRLLLLTSAYHGDLNNNISWGQIAFQEGLNGFYGSADANDWPFSAPNQPPLTILLFAACAWLWQVFHTFFWFLNNNIPAFPSGLIWFWEEKGMTVLVKLPSLIADMGVGALIYKFVKEGFGRKIGELSLAIWLFNPVIWYNSAIWGQTDAIVNFFGLLAIFSLLQKNLVVFGLFYTLSILFKGSLAIVAPVLLFVIYTQNYPVRTIIKMALVSLVAILAVSIWFYPHVAFPIWFYDLYKFRILPGEIGYLTANAFNFWWLVDAGSTYDNVLFAGISARMWGFLLVSVIFVYVFITLINKKFSNSYIFWAITVVAFGAFLFMTRMHERYLYPFFVYGILLAVRSKPFLVLYSLLAICHIVNLYNLFWFPNLPSLRLFLEMGELETFLAAFNLVLFISLLKPRLFIPKDTKGQKAD